MPDNEDNDWQYGFYDSDNPQTVWWYVFGLPFKTPEMAKHTADKNCWGQPVIVRRRAEFADWEIAPTIQGNNEHL